LEYYLFRSYLKIRIFGQDQGETEDQPAGILKYVEDLRRGLNADIGRKDFFEMNSSDFPSAPAIKNFVSPASDAHEGH